MVLSRLINLFCFWENTLTFIVLNRMRNIHTKLFVLFYFSFFFLGTSCKHRCCSAEVVILFIFSSGIEYRTLSQICGRLYLSIFLFRVGLFTDIYPASFKALAILCPSLPMILKFLTDVVWPVVLWFSNIGEGASRCSLYLSPKVLDDSPIYSSLQSIMSHLNQHMTLLILVIVSLSFGDTSRFYRICPPLKCTCILYIYRWSCNFHRDLVNMALQCSTSFHFVGLLESASCWMTPSGLPVLRELCLLPTWDICITSGPLPDGVIIWCIVEEWSIWLWPCVWGC